MKKHEKITLKVRGLKADAEKSKEKVKEGSKAMDILDAFIFAYDGVLNYIEDEI